MNTFFHFYALLAVIHFLSSGVKSTQGFDWCSLTCSGQQHTMCKYKAGGPPECAGGSRGLTDEEKKSILDIHNKLRAKVARGGERPQPPAADMNELLWDDELAEVAQRWIEQCQFTFEHDKCRTAKDETQVGQNLAMHNSMGFPIELKPIIKNGILGWYNEVEKFKTIEVEGDWVNSDEMIGHYTQLVWANTTHVGCGLYSNRENKFDVVKLACNYKPAGNVVMIEDGTESGLPVYTVGRTASKCITESKRYPGLCSPKDTSGQPSDSDPALLWQLLDRVNQLLKDLTVASQVL